MPLLSLSASRTRQPGDISALPRSQSLAWLAGFFLLAIASSQTHAQAVFVCAPAFLSFFFLVVVRFAHFLQLFRPFYFAPLRSAADQGRNNFIPCINAPALAGLPLALLRPTSQCGRFRVPLASVPSIAEISAHRLTQMSGPGVTFAKVTRSPRMHSVRCPGKLPALGQRIYCATSNFSAWRFPLPAGASANTKKLRPALQPADPCKSSGLVPVLFSGCSLLCL